MIGAKDMAFPKLNMVSYWFMWPAFALHLVEFLRSRRSGRRRLDLVSDRLADRRAGFAGPRIPAGAKPVATGLICVGISSMMGSVNYITTIINMRAPA